MNLADEIDAEGIAKLTEGASGADIKAIAMEAGMFAIRSDRESVTASDFEDAVRKVMGMPKIESHQLGSMFA
jgi:proteasome regulatory subunit